MEDCETNQVRYDISDSEQRDVCCQAVNGNLFHRDLSDICLYWFKSLERDVCTESTNFISLIRQHKRIGIHTLKCSLTGIKYADRGKSDKNGTISGGRIRRKCGARFRSMVQTLHVSGARFRALLRVHMSSNFSVSIAETHDLRYCLGDLES